MAKYYLDFVGLNTFIYEPNGYDQREGFLEKVSEGFDIFVQQNTFNGIDAFHLFDNPKDDIKYSKNYAFSHELPTTASFFPALMLHRNGPYGFPTWKQLRVGDNPLTRKQRKENIFTHVVEPGPEQIVAIYYSGGQISSVDTIRERYGSIRIFDEVAVTSKYSPLEIHYKTATDPTKNFVIKMPLGNLSQHFNNEELNLYYNFVDCEQMDYHELKKLYLNRAANSRSPIDEISFIRYKETIFPNSIYTYKSYVRQRTNFVFPWRDDRSDRIEKTLGEFTSGAPYALTQSLWPMDVSTNWQTRNNNHLLYPEWIRDHGYRNISSSPMFGGLITRKQTQEQDFGILQNSYNRYSTRLDDAINQGLMEPDLVLKCAPLYFYHQMSTSREGSANPNGMRIENLTTGSTLLGTQNLSLERIPAGETPWEANTTRQIHVPNSNPPEYISAPVGGPFSDSYNDMSSDIRLKGQNYSIVAEYRMSQHIDELLTNESLEDVYNIFQITGSKTNINDSNDNRFYQIYTNSDFLEYFDAVRVDHENLLEAPIYTMTCNAIMKFVPYEGFYPQQRTVQLAQQFFNSYKNHFVSDSGSAFQSNDFNAMNIMTPLFAPGVLFNTIKSGIAVDYPIITGSALSRGPSGSITGSSPVYPGWPSGLFKATEVEFESASIPSLFDRRIPFEALVIPSMHLSKYLIPCNVPHPSGNLSSSVYWTGEGDRKYVLMANDFLSSVPEFFLKGEQFTTILSLPMNDAGFGVAEQHKAYTMRVYVRKSTEGATEPIDPLHHLGSSLTYTPPQYTFIQDGGNYENFTMYSRPTAFGPNFTVKNSSSSDGDAFHFSHKGENYVFTPPYYYGQSWADILFLPTETKKYTLDEIIQQSTVQYFNYADNSSISETSKTALIHANAMKLDASVNLFGVVSVNEATGLVTDSNKPNSRLAIQTKFETPMLNFSHLSGNTSVTLPDSGSQAVARGMWHQYGRIEKDPAKGIFMGVTDIPHSWLLYSNYFSGSRLQDVSSIPGEGLFYNEGSANSRQMASLADLIGMDMEEKRLGQLPAFKKVSEAIVCVPFIEELEERKFFAVGVPETAYFYGLSMTDKYVFPPHMDFRKDRNGNQIFPNVKPYKMIVFEFEHEFSQQDLADIWQGLPPELHRSFKKVSSTKTDSLNFGPTPRNRIKWMVFKVKQRSKTNSYFDKVVGEFGKLKQSDMASNSGFVESQIDYLSSESRAITETSSKFSYNWPYDFFSMVELINIEVTAKMMNSNYTEPLIEDLPTRGSNQLSTPGEYGVNTPGMEIIQNQQAAAIVAYAAQAEAAEEKRTEIFKQVYDEASNITTNYFKEPGSGVQGENYNPRIVTLPGGDFRFEDRREYVTMSMVTIVYYKYDPDNPKMLQGDQT